LTVLTVVRLSTPPDRRAGTGLAVLRAVEPIGVTLEFYLDSLANAVGFTSTREGQ